MGWANIRAASAQNKGVVIPEELGDKGGWRGWGVGAGGAIVRFLVPHLKREEARASGQMLGRDRYYGNNGLCLRRDREREETKVTVYSAVWLHPDPVCGRKGTSVSVSSLETRSRPGDMDKQADERGEVLETC